MNRVHPSCGNFDNQCDLPVFSGTQKFTGASAKLCHNRNFRRGFLLVVMFRSVELRGRCRAGNVCVFFEIACVGNGVQQRLNFLIGLTAGISGIGRIGRIAVAAYVIVRRKCGEAERAQPHQHREKQRKQSCKTVFLHGCLPPKQNVVSIHTTMQKPPHSTKQRWVTGTPSSHAAVSHSHRIPRFRVSPVASQFVVLSYHIPKKMSSPARRGIFTGFPKDTPQRTTGADGRFYLFGHDICDILKSSPLQKCRFS